MTPVPDDKSVLPASSVIVEGKDDRVAIEATEPAPAAPV